MKGAISANTKSQQQLLYQIVREARTKWWIYISFELILGLWCQKYILMGYCNKDITSLLTHWRYIFLALTYGHMAWIPHDITIQTCLRYRHLMTKYSYIHPHKVVSFNPSAPGQNGCHFAGNIFRCIFMNERFVFWLKFHWSLFLWIRSTIFQHWFRQLLGAKYKTSHCQNQCWPNSLEYISSTRWRWLKIR